MDFSTLLASSSIVSGLSEVEATIRSKFTSDASQLSSISDYLFSLGGKRIRPILSLICASLYGLTPPHKDNERGRQLIDVAAGIELIHMATLLHDDIIDKSPLRRKKQSPYVKFGIDSTLLTGDFLLVRAFGLCSRLDRFVIDATEQACVELTEGEILELPLHAAAHDRSTSLTIAKKKTASLFRLTAETAAHIAGASPEAVKHLANFGEQLGVSFQILDDILDVVADQDLLGKPSGQDLRERKPSLVNVLWLESGSARAKKLLSAPAGDEEAFVRDSLAELRAHSVIKTARAEAMQYSGKALESLEAALMGVSYPSSSKKMIEALVEYVNSRVS